jgi:mitotic-spindle organizing protein 1
VCARSAAQRSARSSAAPIIFPPPRSHAKTLAFASFSFARPQNARAVAFEISRLLDTGLDKETLSVLISLVESGVHPEALAAVVKELRREAAELKARCSACVALRCVAWRLRVTLSVFHVRVCVGGGGGCCGGWGRAGDASVRGGAVAEQLVG